MNTRSLGDRCLLEGHKMRKARTTASKPSSISSTRRSLKSRSSSTCAPAPRRLREPDHINLAAGRLLGANAARTVLLHPLALAAAYLLLHFCGGRATPAAMAFIALFWGAAHTSGLIVAQVWLSAEAQEAPEFAIGVYISAINLGVTVGALAGGWSIARFGMAGAIFSGLLFAALALALIVAKLLLYGAPWRRALSRCAAVAAPGKSQDLTPL